MMFQTYLNKRNYTEWENHFVGVLYKHDPLNSKVIRGSDKPFISHYVEVCIKENNKQF